MNATAAVEERATGLEDTGREYVTLTIAGQLFGIPVLTVQDVLGPRDVARIPLADPVIAGSINLRGRIVTVIDMRKRLGLPPRTNDDPGMNVVVEHDGNLYSLQIDAVGEVMSLSAEAYERNPATIDPLWREFSNGIYRLNKNLLIVLDVDRILEIGSGNK